LNTHDDGLKARDIFHVTIISQSVISAATALTAGVGPWKSFHDDSIETGNSVGKAIVGNGGGDANGLAGNGRVRSPESELEELRLGVGVEEYLETNATKH
jgi:hypothetical protein